MSIGFVDSPVHNAENFEAFNSAIPHVKMNKKLDHASSWLIKLNWRYHLDEMRLVLVDLALRKLLNQLVPFQALELLISIPILTIFFIFIEGHLRHSFLSFHPCFHSVTSSHRDRLLGLGRTNSFFNLGKILWKLLFKTAFSTPTKLGTHSPWLVPLWFSFVLVLGLWVAWFEISP